MHLSGVIPVGTRDTTFHIKNQQIRSLRHREIDRFLGMPVRFQITRGVKEVAKLMETANKILQCNLAPWQKLDALKSFYFPALNFQMRTALLQKGDWTKLDKYIRASIKRILNVPQEASNERTGRSCTCVRILEELLTVIKSCVMNFECNKLPL
jgi:hypothetical protein